MQTLADCLNKSSGASETETLTKNAGHSKSGPFSNQDYSVRPTKVQSSLRSGITVMNEATTLQPKQKEAMPTRQKEGRGINGREQVTGGQTQDRGNHNKPMSEPSGMWLTSGNRREATYRESGNSLLTALEVIEFATNRPRA